ncbi:MAG TPA: transposase [Candidatus Nitrosocosmicus sp.]
MKNIFPPEKPLRTVGRPIIPYRKVIDGILYVLRIVGCQWKMLPKEYGLGSTYHHGFQKWNSLDIFEKRWIRILKSMMVLSVSTGHGNPSIVYP